MVENERKGVHQPLVCRLDVFLMIAMAVAIGAFCIPVVFGSRHIPYDFEGYNFPLWKFTFDSFREGSFPVLDPFVYSGVPFLAETQSGIFYPLNGGLLYLASWWLRDLSVGQVQWINGLHMLIGGAGAYVLGRLYGASSLRAFAIAMLILFSGVPLANQQHPGILAAGAWLPWLLISIELIITSASFLATAGFAVVVALIITIGNLPHALVILLVGGIYALTRLVALVVAQDWRMPWTQLGLLLAGGVLGAMLAAPVWLPLLEFLPREAAVAPPGPVPIWSFATAVFPGILGNFDDISNIAWGDVTKTYYFSGPGFWLALATALLARGSLQRCLQVVLVVIVLFGFGPVQLVHAVQSVPGIGIILRPPWVVFLVFFFPFLMLAGQPDSPRLRWLAVGLGWATAVVILATMSYYGYALDRNKVLVGLAWLAVFSVLTLGRWRGNQVRLDTLLILCAAALFAQHTLGPQNLWSQPTNPKFASGTDFANGRHDLIATLRKDGEPYRIAVDQEILGGAFNGWPRVWKLEAIGGMEPTLDGDYAKYLRDNVAQFSTNRIFGRFRLDSRAFQLLNVRFLVTRSPSTIDHPDWDLVYDSFFRIYEYRKFTPRFRVVGNERAEQAPPVLVVRQGSDGWIIKTIAPGDGYQLVVSERWNLGWHAQIDLQPVPINPSKEGLNLIIDLPTGPSTIKLEFRSYTLRYAIGTAGIAGILIVGIALAGWSAERKDRPTKC